MTAGCARDDLRDLEGVEIMGINDDRLDPAGDAVFDLDPRNLLGLKLVFALGLGPGLGLETIHVRGLGQGDTRATGGSVRPGRGE